MYYVGWNRPGYLPDSDPYEHETFEEACDSLIEELEADRDDYIEYSCGETDDDIVQDYNDQIEYILVVQKQKPRDVNVSIDGISWWIFHREEVE